MQLSLGDGAFALDLPPDWRVDWQNAFSARIVTSVAAAPVFVLVDSFRDPVGIAANRISHWLTPYDDTLPKHPADQGESYLFGYSPSHRGRGPHILAADLQALPPNVVRRIEFAIPAGEMAPQRSDARENAAFLAWAMRYEPLSTLISLLPKIRTAKQETALDRVAVAEGLRRESLLRAFHFCLPEDWLIEEQQEADGRTLYLIEKAEDRELASLWLELHGFDLGHATAAQREEVLTRGAAGIAARQQADARTLGRVAWRRTAPDEALIQYRLRYEDREGPVEDQTGIRLALRGDWYFQVFYHFVYPPERLADPGFPALRDGFWQRFLDGWIAPEI